MTTTKIQQAVVLNRSEGVTCPVPDIAVDTPSTSATISGRRTAVNAVPRPDTRASAA